MVEPISAVDGLEVHYIMRTCGRHIGA